MALFFDQNALFCEGFYKTFQKWVWDTKNWTLGLPRKIGVIWITSSWPLKPQKVPKTTQLTSFWYPDTIWPHILYPDTIWPHDNPFWPHETRGCMGQKSLFRVNLACFTLYTGHYYKKHLEARGVAIVYSPTFLPRKLSEMALLWGEFGSSWPRGGISNIPTP